MAATRFRCKRTLTLLLCPLIVSARLGLQAARLAIHANVQAFVAFPFAGFGAGLLGCFAGGSPLLGPLAFGLCSGLLFIRLALPGIFLLCFPLCIGGPPGCLLGPLLLVATAAGFFLLAALLLGTYLLGCLARFTLILLRLASGVFGGLLLSGSLQTGGLPGPLLLVATLPTVLSRSLFLGSAVLLGLSGLLARLYSAGGVLRTSRGAFELTLSSPAPRPVYYRAVCVFLRLVSEEGTRVASELVLLFPSSFRQLPGDGRRSRIPCNCWRDSGGVAGNFGGPVRCSRGL